MKNNEESSDFFLLHETWLKEQNRFHIKNHSTEKWDRSDRKGRRKESNINTIKYNI